MTVAELIEKLKKHPKDYDVRFIDKEWGEWREVAFVVDLHYEREFFSSVGLTDHIEE